MQLDLLSLLKRPLLSKRLLVLFRLLKAKRSIGRFDIQLEQVVAKTGLPPFLLGLSWSTTERMSRQQADILTTELESYRNILTPVAERVCRMALDLRGLPGAVAVDWQSISLQDETEQAQARLTNAQAALIEQQLTERSE